MVASLFFIYYSPFFFTGKKKARGWALNARHTQPAKCFNSERGTSRERKAIHSESRKLTIKLPKPIIPIPNIHQIIFSKLIIKSTP